MKYSRMYIPTSKENIQENEALNYKLLNRAGYLRKSAAGVYTFLFLGAKTLDKLQGLIAKTLEDRGCYRLEAPSSQSIDSQFRLIAAGRLSYRELPIGAWFIKERVLDNMRPRLGLLHPRIKLSLQGFKLLRDSKELTMETELLLVQWKELSEALKLDCLKVEALSEHLPGHKDLILFWPYDSGEDRIIRCSKCGKAVTPDSLKCTSANDAFGSEGELKLVHTPETKTIMQVAGFLGKEQKDIVKTLIYKADERLIGALIRGDRELSEIKLKNLLNCQVLAPATAEEVYQATGAEVGFAGPIGLKAGIICDNEVMSMKSMVIGANKTDYHYVDASAFRDFKSDMAADLRCGTKEDACPECGGSVEVIDGFTLAKANKRGAEYAKRQGLVYNGSSGEADLMHILDFEFDLYRLLAAAIESNNDEAGLRLPSDIAPFDIIVMPVHADNEMQQSAALEIYSMLKSKGYDVLFDDRGDRVSVKFKDSELIGIPLRITAGRKAAEGIVEIKPRTGEMTELHIDSLMDYIEGSEVNYAGEI